MTLQWLKWINLTLVIFALGCLATAMLIKPNEIVQEKTVVEKISPLPKRAFIQPEEAYHSVGAPFLELQYSPASLQLPDLRKRLIYHGKNGRPDAHEENTFLHFDILGCKHPVSIPPGTPLYIRYDGNAKTTPYTFSPDNEETVLWLEAEPQTTGAIVTLKMLDEKGQLVQEPTKHAEFTLQEKEFNRFGAAPWQLGKWRVDGSLFARQRARWYGKDLFLEEHGGEEFSDAIGKNRVDFGEGEETYSVFLGEGDVLVWENDRWNQAEIGETTQGKPLLVINKVEDRLMNGDLWDQEGKSKIGINLIRSMEAWVPKNIQKQFKFVAAKTRTQFAFVINKERMVLSPDDWLLQTSQGWKKLESIEDIDQYVSRKLSGVLFVFEGCCVEEGKQTLRGMMYNSSRTEAQEIEIAMHRATEPKQYTYEYGEDEDEFEFEFDEDDDEELPDEFFELHYPGD